MKSSVLLYVGQLLEPPRAVGALVGLLASVDADVLNKLKRRGQELYRHCLVVGTIDGQH